MHSGVLIIEDDPGIAAALRVRLNAAGFHAHWIDDGKRGLASAMGRPPDAIILDLIMPGMNGIEVCRQARAAPALRYTPILIVSANVAEDARAQAMGAGADAFLTKPYDAAQLIQRVRDLIQQQLVSQHQEN